MSSEIMFGLREKLNIINVEKLHIDVQNIKYTDIIRQSFKVISNSRAC